MMLLGLSDRSKQTPSSSSDNINEKGDPKEPDYDEYQLEEEQEEETG
jgi:hypothetical protein